MVTVDKEKNKHNLEGNGFTRRQFLEKTARTTAAVAAAGAVPALLARCGRDASAFDVIVRGGSVYDGVTAKPFTADIGIKGDRIAAIGDLADKKAAKVIDAAGLIVTPGFIDVHTHCDLTFQLTGAKRHLARVMPSWKGNHNYLYQGVATVVSGNCGYGYEDTDYWFGILDSIGFGTNVLHLAPHGMIREGLFGKGVLAELSGAQLEAMKGRVAEEMEKGAVGLSCGLEYAPGIYTPTKELIELAKVARAHGGIFTIHMRDESGKAAKNGSPGVIESIKEAIEIGRRAEIPVEISHFKIAAPYGKARPEEMLALVEKARMEGLDITADQYPYDAGSTRITILLPGEFATSDSIRDEYKTKEGQKKVREAILETFSYLPPEKTLVTMYTGKEEYEGKNIREIARMMGKDPADAYVAMVCEETSPTGVFFLMDMKTVRALMPHEYIITASDGWTVPKGMTKPHPRTYGTFPRKLHAFVLDEKIMTLPAAIRSMTSLPAEKFRIKGRGRIAVDNFADIAVIDLKTIAGPAEYLDPHQYSTGVRYLLVNGVLSIENGTATGDRGGRATRRA